MSYAALPPDFRAFAERELTPKQLDCFKLWMAGAGWRRISRLAGVTPDAVRGRVERAVVKLERHPSAPAEWPRGRSAGDDCPAPSSEVLGDAA